MGLTMAPARPDVDPGEDESPFGPVFSQASRLLFSKWREAIVIPTEGRSLTMTDDVQTAHESILSGLVKLDESPMDDGAVLPVTANPATFPGFMMNP